MARYPESAPFGRTTTRPWRKRGLARTKGGEKWTGEPFAIKGWSARARAIIGDCLGHIAADSYRRGKFLASALVYTKESNEPGEGFWGLAETVGLLHTKSKDARLLFWFEHVALARAWYAANK